MSEITLSKERKMKDDASVMDAICVGKDFLGCFCLGPN